MKKDQKGFTILELMIATTVFGVMLLLATAGILQIGKIYYKGITTNRTQETTRAIVDDISRNYQINPYSTYGNSDTAGGDRNGARSICVGLTRYTYRTGVIATAAQRVLWVDKINPTRPCSALDLDAVTPGDASTDGSDLGKSFRREMIPANMRLSAFSLTNDTANKTLSISVRAVYGATDLTELIDGKEVCKPISAGGQFCAVSELNSFVKTRL